MSLILYLINTATASPFPTTSRKVSTTNNSSDVTLGCGLFSSVGPGNTDSGQWNPSSAIGDNTASAEIDNTGASPGTTRQGWLYDEDLTGQQLPSGQIDLQLRLTASQNNRDGRLMLRVSVVTGSAGAWTTVANLLTTSIPGETSHSSGQVGWRANEGSRITVTSAAANYAVTICTAFTPHTFASGERLLFELGFGDRSDGFQPAWRLVYNNASSFITLPDLTSAGAYGIATETDTAVAVSAVQVASYGVATEASSVLAPSASQAAAFGIAAETDTALAPTASQPGAFGVATETDVALPLSAAQFAGFGLVGESDIAAALSASQVAAFGLASETDAALALTRFELAESRYTVKARRQLRTVIAEAPTRTVKAFRPNRTVSGSD